MEKIFQGKNAVVTGAAMGIGRATAELFAEKGARVVALDYNQEKLHEVSASWKKEGLDITPIQCDVTNGDALAAAFKKITDLFGKLAILANVAGVVRYGKIDELEERDWDYQLDTNLKAMFLTCRAAVTLMRLNGGGSIVNVASVQAMASQQTVAPYAASKGGVISFTRSIALDYAGDGIRANSVLPGSVETPMLRAAGEQFNPQDPVAAMQNWGALHPLGFLMQPRDIANVISFLSSDDARVITGAPIIADSGLLARLGV
jgi:NAD(P)-dependent dehydrogenase (short-subunit alcohol dehydrogenase family)